MTTVRVAAAADIHADEHARPAVEAAFASLDGRCDLVVLAGDLTTHGEPDEARVVAEACRSVGVPLVTVLGNHDWHVNRRDEVVAVLEAAGIVVLDPGHATFDVDGTSVGVAGTKGFVGGFPGSHIPDFGEPLLRQVYRETTAEVEALDRELDEIAGCDVRIAVLHYAPAMGTLSGEPEGIWAMLGSARLAAPLARDRVDLVVHGHAHAGTFETRLGALPVYNVAVPVIGRDFWIFELGARRAPAPPAVRVESRPADPGEAGSRP